MGHPDEQVAEQQLRLERLRPQAFDVLGQGVDLQDLHPALDAAGQGLLLVLAAVVSDPVAQERADLRQVVCRVRAEERRVWKECVSKCKSRWCPDTSKKKN